MSCNLVDYVIDMPDCRKERRVQLAEQKVQLHQVMKENFSIFENRPGHATVVEHQIRTGDAALEEGAGERAGGDA